ncbi:MAG: hypothetical protein PVG64_09590 [Syntrophobacterales bacterium]
MSSQESLASEKSLTFPELCLAILQDTCSLFAGLLDLALRLFVVFALVSISKLGIKAEAPEIDLADIE